MSAPKSAIAVTAEYERSWPLVGEHMKDLWELEGPTELIRLASPDCRGIDQALTAPERITRLVGLGLTLTAACLDKLPGLREAALDPLGPETAVLLKERGVAAYGLPSQGCWGQSVAEFGLALTLCGLRRIPQTHRAILSDLSPWDYDPPASPAPPGFERRGVQFGDDDRFTNGTIAGKRVRIVGAGNIASRYASWTHTLGAEVAAWDPFASEPCFHRTGARREYHLDRLVQDAEIFAPMVPLTDQTRGLVSAAHIQALPQGCLVVLVTRADICDMPALRRRVLNDELALAADVFDVEPLPLEDPLLGRHNVVHTPHNAGRTRHANQQLAEALAAQFQSRQ